MNTRSLAAAVFLATASVLTAQPTATVAKGTPFGERLDVEVVNVDVVVTDDKGQRIVDLSRDDFELEVDGRRVPLDYFSPPARVAGRPAAAAVAPADSGDGAVEMSTANLFVFVDQSALEWRTSRQILNEVSEFVMPRTGGNERIMVAAFADNLRILSPPTAERTRIAGAFSELEKLLGRGTLVAAERSRLERDVRENARPRAQKLIMTEAGEVAPEQAVREARQEQTDTAMLRDEIESFGEQELLRQERSLQALGEWIGGLAAIDGRKSVLFASAGFTSQPELFLTQFLDQKRKTTPTDRNQDSKLQTQRIALNVQFEEVVRAAENARVAFYTLSPRETPNLGTAEVTSSGEISTALPPRDPAIAESLSSMRRLAEATGGDAMVVDDRLSDRLSGVADDAAASYSLGFSTGEMAGSGEHKIEVRTRRPGLEVRHRESFRRISLAERAEAALVAAATLETTVNPLAMRLELGEPAPIDRKGKGALVPVLVRIPLALVTLVPDGDHSAARLSARIAVLNESQHVRMGTMTPIVISVPENELELALGSFWAYRAEVMVGRGLQRVAVVVVDEQAGTVSTLYSTVDRPE